MDARIAHTFVVYTPVWERGGEHFRAWLKIGIGWRDEQNVTSSCIHSLPVHAEENLDRLLPLCGNRQAAALAGDDHARRIHVR
jgi:hypothetical protein